MQLRRLTLWSSPEFKSLSWRRRLAWRLRALADGLEGDTVSFTLSGEIPRDTTHGDLWDAIAFGVAAIQNYLADLSNERQVK